MTAKQARRLKQIAKRFAKIGKVEMSKALSAQIKNLVTPGR
jgi:hypothetical protein